MKDEVNKSRPIAPEHKYRIMIYIMASLSLIMIINGIAYEGYVTRADAFINEEMQAFFSPAMNKAMIYVTSAFDIYPAVLLLSAMSGILIYLKRYRETARFTASMGGGAAIVFLLKDIIMRERPENALIEAYGHSFPSAHAAVATVFFLSVMHAFKDDIKGKTLRIAFISINVLLAGLVGFTRIYLNVHWASDVVAGFLIGGLVFSLVNEASDFFKRKRV